MTEVKKPTMDAFLVDEMEFERGLGSRREDQYLFPTEALAKEFVEKYNTKHNNQGTVPDWYMRQDYIGLVKVTETQFNKFKYTGDYVNMPEWEFKPL